MADKNPSIVTSVINQFLTQLNDIKDNESAVAVIIQIIDSPNIYSFSEFLETPIISQVNLNLKNKNLIKIILFFVDISLKIHHLIIIIYY